MNKSTLLTVFIVVIVLAFIVLPTTVAPSKAPDFTVQTTDGRFNLSDQNKPVLIDFMTPKCLSCKEVEENLKDIYPDYEEKFEIISIDVSNKSIDRLSDYKDERDIPWEIGSGDAELFVDKYQGSTVPVVVIIDENGNLTFKEQGVIGKEKLREEMDAVLEGKADQIELANYGVYALALMGGVASFFSPCSFPLLPSYIAYYIRPDKESEKSKGEKEGSGSISGISMGIQAAFGIVLVFGVVGGIAVAGGSWISDYLPYLEPVVGVVVLILGAIMLTDIDLGSKIKLLTYRLKKGLGISQDRQASDPSPFFYGVGYGTTSAGCTAPVFIAVVLSSWLSKGTYGAIIVLLIYLSTMAALMIVFSLLTVYFRDKIIGNMTKAVRWVNKAAAVILMAAGAYLIYAYFAVL